MHNFKFAGRIKALKPSAIREILKFTADPSVISLAAGNPSAESFPVEIIRDITNSILSENPVAALQYGVTEGDREFIQIVKNMCKERYGVGASFDELIITSGAQQVVELCAKAMCDEGDAIICESPSFIGSLNAFRSHNLNLVGIDMDDDGINIEKLEHALKTVKNVKLIYVIPTFQNPTGITMSIEKRRAVYDLALKYNVLILEDNPYSELYFDTPPPAAIKSLDKDGIVVYAGSFSKILSPGLRVGYCVAPKEIISKMTVAKQVSDVHTTLLSQLITKNFITNYDLNAHIEHLRAIYKRKAFVMVNGLREHMGESLAFAEPKGGLFLWCTMPDGVDVQDFCKRAVENGVAVVPGNAFLVDETMPTHSIRLNYSTPSDGDILEGIMRLKVDSSADRNQRLEIRS